MNSPLHACNFPGGDGRCLRCRIIMNGMGVFLGEAKTEGSGRVSHNKRVNRFGFPLPPLLYTFEPL